MNYYLISVITCALLSLPLHAAPYDVTKESVVAFSGTHADTPFSGTIEQWNAEIDFDSHDIAATTAIFTFDTTAFITNNPSYDGALTQRDWLNSDDYPHATFVVHDLRAKTDSHHYIVTGVLTIGEISNILDIPVTIIQNATTITARASFTIDRLAYNLGEKSDPDAEWVGRDIMVNTTIIARTK